MACGNLREGGQSADHCARVAQLAVDLVAAANATPVCPAKPHLGSINMRAGLHAGPLVATVLGSSQPKFTLFGDTVNTASRMESNSAKNRVTLSGAAAGLLRLQAPHLAHRLVPRGPVAIKGKGEMELFFFEPEGSPHLLPKKEA